MVSEGKAADQWVRSLKRKALTRSSLHPVCEAVNELIHRKDM